MSPRIRIHWSFGSLSLAVALGVVARADSPEELNQTFRAGIEAHERGDHREAILQLESAAARAPAILGAENKNTAVIINSLANAYFKAGDLTKAEPKLLRALAIAEKSLGAEHSDVALILETLAATYERTNRLAAAEPVRIRILKIRGVSDAGKMQSAAAYNQLGLLYDRLNRRPEALAQFRKAVEIGERAKDADNEQNAVMMINLTAAYFRSGDMAAGDRQLQRAMLFAESGNGAETSVRLFLGFGNLLASLGQHQRAIPVFERCALLAGISTLEDETLQSQALDGWGAAHVALRQFDKAEEPLARALEIAEQRTRADELEIANAANALALAHLGRRDPDRAKPLLERCYLLREAKLGPAHPDVAQVMHNVAVMYDLFQDVEDTAAQHRIEEAVRQGKDRSSAIPASREFAAKALAKLQQSHRILLASEGKDSVSIAHVEESLATRSAKLQQFTQAREYYRHVMDVFRQNIGPDHPDTLRATLGAAYASLRCDDPDAAADFFDRIRRADRRTIANVLPLLDDAKRQSFLDNLEFEHLEPALALAWKYPENASLAARSAEWVANAKGVIFELMSGQVSLARKSRDPAQQTIVKQLSEIRERQAKVTFQFAGAESGRVLEDLAQQERALHAKLTEAGGWVPSSAWIELAAVRRALPADGVLVDLMLFTPFAADGKTFSPHYGAWVIPPLGQGDVRFVDLGSVGPINNAVQEFQTQMKAARDGRIQEVGEVEAERELRASLAELSKLILSPLRSPFNRAKQIILCPDQKLWLIPWAALSIEDDRYAVEQWSFRYVTSARDLVAIKTPSKNPPRVVADPDFNLRPQDVPAALTSVFGAGFAQTLNLLPTVATPQANIAANLRSAKTIDAVALLPGTATEAELITPNLTKICGEAPKLYYRQSALEDIVKRFRAPRVLVIATHGFVLPDLKDKGIPLAERQPSTNPALANPLLRCGLLFAGCNQAQAAGGKFDDGVLTGLEIVGVDLQGTELVVLSACETGLGQVNFGEGVAGLRQAFLLAGAHSVAATLWQIPDQATANLMNDFFAGMAEGRSKAEALRNAQVARISARRERNGAAHPLFWAAFTLTGQ